MRIGVPKEVKPGEGRVALLPEQAALLVGDGHEVFVQQGAGGLSGARDEDYAAAGAVLLETGAQVYRETTLIVKVKEIMPEEYGYLRSEHVLFTNIHGAVNRDQLDELLKCGLTAIAAEETHAHGSPNSVLAGEVGAFEGLRLVFAPHGGAGRHFFSHFGAAPAHALVLGLGGVGQGALRTLLRLGVSVTGFDIDVGVRRKTEQAWGEVDFQARPVEEISEHLASADVIYNCVLWPKQREDHLIFRSDLKSLKTTAVIVDISCDPAGAVETSRPTTWDDPVYVEDSIRHFCVDNIPGAVPVTASAGYARDIIENVRQIAKLGALEASRQNPLLARGLTCAGGTLTLEEAARVQDREFTPAGDLLAAQS